MSGTISFSPTARWSAASWLFDWVLKAVADDRAEDAELAAELRGIVHENIGWLALNDLTDEQQTTVRRTIRESIRITAERGFPANMPGREDALKLLDDLVRLAAE